MSQETRNEQGLTEEEFLEQYNSNKYEKPSVTTDMAIFTVMDSVTENNRLNPEKELKVLLIKRKDHPYMGKWALPGGFVNMDEDLEVAAYRELEEETGITNIYAEQLFTWGEVNRDPRMRVISVSYLSLIDSNSISIQAGSDAEEVEWFKVADKLLREVVTTTETGSIVERFVELKLTSELEILTSIIKTTTTREGAVSRVTHEVIEQDGLAFDHPRIIQYSLMRLRNKIEYTNIAFNLMPPLFTLTSLQKVYEVILDKELLKANFRRKISEIVEETNEEIREGAYRPSKLFRYNVNWQSKNF